MPNDNTKQNTEQKLDLNSFIKNIGVDKNNNLVYNKTDGENTTQVKLFTDDDGGFSEDLDDVIEKLLKGNPNLTKDLKNFKLDNIDMNEKVKTALKPKLGQLKLLLNKFAEDNGISSSSSGKFRGNTDYERDYELLGKVLVYRMLEFLSYSVGENSKVTDVKSFQKALKDVFDKDNTDELERIQEVNDKMTTDAAKMTLEFVNDNEGIEKPKGEVPSEIKGTSDAEMVETAYPERYKTNYDKLQSAFEKGMNEQREKERSDQKQTFEDPITHKSEERVGRLGKHGLDTYIKNNEKLSRIVSDIEGQQWNIFNTAPKLIIGLIHGFAAGEKWFQSLADTLAKQRKDIHNQVKKLRAQDIKTEIDNSKKVLANPKIKSYKELEKKLKEASDEEKEGDEYKTYQQYMDSIQNTLAKTLTYIVKHLDIMSNILNGLSNMSYAQVNTKSRMFWLTKTKSGNLAQFEDERKLLLGSVKMYVDYMRFVKSKFSDFGGAKYNFASLNKGFSCQMDSNAVKDLTNFIDSVNTDDGDLKTALENTKKDIEAMGDLKLEDFTMKNKTADNINSICNGLLSNLTASVELTEVKKLGDDVNLDKIPKGVKNSAENDGDEEEKKEDKVDLDKLSGKFNEIEDRIDKVNDVIVNGLNQTDNADWANKAKEGILNPLNEYSKQTISFLHEYYKAVDKNDGKEDEAFGKFKDYVSKADKTIIDIVGNYNYDNILPKMFCLNRFYALAEEYEQKRLNGNKDEEKKEESFHLNLSLAGLISESDTDNQIVEELKKLIEEVKNLVPKGSSNGIYKKSTSDWKGSYDAFYGKLQNVKETLLKMLENHGSDTNEKKFDENTVKQYKESNDGYIVLGLSIKIVKTLKSSSEEKKEQKPNNNGTEKGEDKENEKTTGESTMFNLGLHKLLTEVLNRI